MRIVVTAGAIIQDAQGRVLVQRRSDYGDWGLPGGAMKPGETVEETMRREVLEETGLTVGECELYAVYSGQKMQYRYPDGNEVVFVMFVFRAQSELRGRMAVDGRLSFQDRAGESLELRFIRVEDIPISDINVVQRPVFEDLRDGATAILRT
jgi:mutator protein MutT